MLNTATLADQYLNGQPVTPTADEIRTFEAWVSNRFDRIAWMVDFTAEEISPEAMQAYWEANARLIVSTAHNEPAFWSKEANAKFRAVHDTDHLFSGCGFDMAGEACAAGYAMSTAPESIHWILWSEVALQAAAAIHTGSFQPQKLVKA
jgi:hypothetical protein